MIVLKRVYYFASCANGYDRGTIHTNEEESIIDRIHMALDLIGFSRDRLVRLCANGTELSQAEEEYLEKMEEKE